MAGNKFFKIEIYKNFMGGESSGEWSNTYRVEAQVATSTVEDPQFVNNALALVNWEKNVHTNAVYISRAVISTAAADEAEAGEEVVKVLPIGQLATRVIPDGAHMMPLNFVACFALAATSGRAGVHQYRGALTSADLVLTDGKYTMVDGVQQNILDYGGMALNQNNTIGDLVIARFKAGFIFGRHVPGINAAGFRYRQTSQKKRAKVSNSERAIIRRIQEATREVSFILASVNSFDSTKDFKNPMAVNAALLELQGALNQLLGLQIGQVNP